MKFGQTGHHHLYSPAWAEFCYFSFEGLWLDPSPNINFCWLPAELVWWTSQSLFHLFNCCDVAGNVNTHGQAAPGRNAHKDCHTHSLELKLRREWISAIWLHTNSSSIHCRFLGEPPPITSRKISYCWKLRKTFKVTGDNPQRRFLLQTSSVSVSLTRWGSSHI